MPDFIIKTDTGGRFYGLIQIPLYLQITDTVMDDLVIYKVLI